MKFNELNKWHLSDNVLGLLIFVERSLELSYDTTPVPEKNMHPTVWEILNDCFKLLALVETGVRKNARDELDFFLEELKDAIKKDPIAKGLIYGNDNYILNRLTTQSTDELRTLLNLTRSILSQKEYWTNLKKLAIELVQTPKKKKEIIEISERCFYFLMAAGYVKSSIYYLIQKIFFFNLSDGIIRDYSSIDKYFDLFDLQHKRFDVLFKCSNRTEDLKGGFDAFSIDFIESPEPKYDEKVERKFFKDKRNTYLVCNNIRALDYLHAVKIAKTKLNKVANIFSFMHHKSNFWYSNNCLVYNVNKNHVVNVAAPSNTMSKTADVGIDIAKEFLGLFLKSFKMKKIL